MTTMISIAVNPGEDCPMFDPKNLSRRHPMLFLSDLEA